MVHWEVYILYTDCLASFIVISIHQFPWYIHHCTGTICHRESLYSEQYLYCNWGRISVMTSYLSTFVCILIMRCMCEDYSSCLLWRACPFILWTSSYYTYTWFISTNWGGEVRFEDVYYNQEYIIRSMQNT